MQRVKKEESTAICHHLGPRWRRSGFFIDHGHRRRTRDEIRSEHPPIDHRWTMGRLPGVTLGARHFQTPASHTACKAI